MEKIQDNQELKREFKNSILALKTVLFNFGSFPPEKFIIKDIPVEWSSLGVIEGDRIKRILLPENINGLLVIYNTPNGGIFPPHFHPNNQSITVLKGGLEIITPIQKTYKTAGQGFKVFKNTPHRIKLEPDTYLSMYFEPSMEKENYLNITKSGDINEKKRTNFFTNFIKKIFNNGNKNKPKSK